MDDLISRQKAIEALYRVDEYNGRSVKAIMYLPSARPEQRWIPVSEKPMPKGLVLVTYNDGDVDLLSQPTSYRRGDIVAWMHLPKPWKGEENV